MVDRKASQKAETKAVWRVVRWVLHWAVLWARPLAVEKVGCLADSSAGRTVLRLADLRADQ